MDKCTYKIANKRPCELPTKWVVRNTKGLQFVCDLHVSRVFSTRHKNEVEYIEKQKDDNL